MMLFDSGDNRDNGSKSVEHRVSLALADSSALGRNILCCTVDSGNGSEDGSESIKHKLVRWSLWKE